MQMTGNTILITGGGTGIGPAFAKRFVARGNHRHHLRPSR